MFSFQIIADSPYPQVSNKTGHVCLSQTQSIKSEHPYSFIITQSVRLYTLPHQISKKKKK